MPTRRPIPSNLNPGVGTGDDTRLTELPQARLLRLTAPFHPIFVHFTIALTAGAFVFDALAFLFRLDALRAIGWWLLAADILLTLGTLGTGVRSRLRLPVEEGEMRSFLRVHMAMGPIFFGLLLAIGVWRGALWQAGAGVTGGYLAAMVGVVLVMAVQGYLGGELVYRYGAEVKFRYRRLPDRITPLRRRPLRQSVIDQSVIDAAAPNR